MKKKILQTIRQHNLLEKGMHVVVGLSGGPDSMCMFDVLRKMAGEWDLKLYPVHVNHMFRPGAAEEDQAFVEAYCQEAGWPCRTFVIDCNAMAEAEGLTSEEAGRKARYDSFRRVAAEIAAGIIKEKGFDTAAEFAQVRRSIAVAVAQNAEDQAETILFRILRGTGVDGLAGIAYKRYDEDGNLVIRPLLDISRRDIEDYCEKQGLNPRRDHTNEEPVYTRNRIRLQLLPYLKEYNPNIMETINRLGAAAAEDSDYLLQEAEKALQEAKLPEYTGTMAGLSTEYLKKLHPAVRKRVYHIALGQIGLKDSLSAAHLAGVEKILESGSPSASWNLPEGYIAEKRYDALCFRKEALWRPASLKMQILPAGEEVQAEGSGLTAKFSLRALTEAYGEDAPGKIILRGREKGDFMTISTGGSLHRKKLQDILVDMKIPKSLRDSLQFAAVGSEILWILPCEESGAGTLGAKGRFSSGYRASEQPDESIIVLEYLS